MWLICWAKQLLLVNTGKRKDVFSCWEIASAVYFCLFIEVRLMRLFANTRRLRVLGNLFVSLYLAITVIGFLGSFGILGAIQKSTGQSVGDGVETSFYVKFYTIGSVGTVLSLFGLYLGWRLFHMFLDMYEALAGMQHKQLYPTSGTLPL